MTQSLWADDGDQFTYQGLKYEVSDETAKTVMVGTHNEDLSGDIVIPATVQYNGQSYSVTEIGWEAFYRCTTLTSVKIPNSVIGIRGSAFSGCTSLTSVDIPNSVKYLSGAFQDCTGLTTVNIPNSVTNLKNTFYGCTSLTSVKIPNSVTNLNYTFYNCTSLKSVDIPKDLVILPENEGSSNFSDLSAMEDTFYGCSSLTTVNIPNSVTVLPATFFGCSSLTSVNIPNSVTGLYNTFRGCTSLTSVKIPNTVTVLSCAFDGCTSLKSVTLNEGLTKIDTRTFDNCTSLTCLTIPSSVTEIARGISYYNYRGPFCGSGLKVIKVETSAEIDKYTFFNGNDEIHTYPKLLLVPTELVSKYETEFADVSECQIASGDINFAYGDSEFGIGLNDSKTLTLNLPDAEYVNGFQTDVTLPTGLSIASKSGELDVTLGSGKKDSHVVSASKVSGTNTYRIVVYSSNNETFTSGDALLNIGMQSDMNLRGGDITIGNTVLSLMYDASLAPEDLTITVPSFIGVENVTVTPAEASLNLGTTLQLTAEVSPSSAWEKNVTWSSSNTKVATVSATGVVTPVAKGTVTITATSTDGTNVTGTATITVTNYAQTLTLGEGNLTIEEDETLQLNPVFTPANAEEVDLTWASTDPAVAYVDEQNVLHSIKPGTATITATNQASDLSASIDVTVTAVLYGDANDDGVVAINDAVTETQYILEKNPSPFNFKKADVNRDRVINILDISRTVSITIDLNAQRSQSASPMASIATKATPMVSGSEVMCADGSRLLVINLHDVQDVTAMQADIDLPEGLAVEDIRLAGEQTQDHIVSYNSGGTLVRLAVYSLSLACMDANTAAIEVVLTGAPVFTGEKAVVYNIFASEPHSQLMHYSDFSVAITSPETTGVENVEADCIAWPADVYNVMGVCVKRAATRADLGALAPGIYIVNGQKVLVK